MKFDRSKWAKYFEAHGRDVVDSEPNDRPKSKRKVAVSKAVSVPKAQLPEPVVEPIEVPKDQTWPQELARKQPDGRSIVNVEWFCTHHCDPPIQAKFNEFDQRAYVIFPKVDGEEAEFEQREVDEAVLREIMFRLHRLGCMVTKGTVDDAIKRLAMRHRFHPVREYLDGWQWDGTRRIHKLLPRYLNAEDTPLNRAFGKAWMISAVRRIREPGCQVDAVLTLQSPQGTGKSTFFRVLAGDAWFNDSLEIGGSAKDVIENATGAWIIELAELSKLGKREVEEVKKFTFDPS